MTDGKLLTKSVKVESKSFIGLKEKKNTANSEYSKKKKKKVFFFFKIKKTCRDIWIAYWQQC